MRTLLLLVLGFLLPPACAPAAAPPDAPGRAVRRGLARLRAGATRYTANRHCFSCHHQALPVAAFGEAKRRGMDVPPGFVTGQVRFTLDSFEPTLARVRKGQAVPGGNTMAAYALFTLEQAGHPADATTAALVEYLLVRQQADGSWPALMPRPPSEGSPFTNAALALQALDRYGSAVDADTRKRIALARGKGKAWLIAGKPATTEDRVFRLRGLVAGGAARETIAAARRGLEGLQRPDGSWAQLDTAAGDAYATATALLSLRAAGLPVTDPAHRKGVAYLVRTQNPDGSWAVTTRSRPVQTFFDNGDPGGKSQFISFLATGWATWALLESMPAPKPRR